MSPLLTNYSFLSPLKRQRAVRNRSNNATPPPSKYSNRLPVLPELSGEQDIFSSPSSSSVLSSTPSPSPRPSPSASPSEKRRSRYGRDEFALDRDFLRTATVDAPNSALAKQKHQTVRLSAFDIVIDISGPTSPVSDSLPLAESSSSAAMTPPRPTRPRDLRRESPPRSRSPTPSLTSMSACSSTDMPMTPLTSDDEWPGLGPSPQLSRKAPAAPRVAIPPLVIIKSTPALLTPDASPANQFEFTLAPFSDPEDEEEQAEGEDEDDLSWYARELGQFVSLASPCAPSASSATGARPDSLLPSPSCGSSPNTKTGPRSRMSKPLPALPRAPGPSPQLDPTFPRRRTTSRQPPPTYPPPPPPPHTLTTPSVRKSLKITVPRAPPRTPLPLDVAEIFDDIDAWSVFVPSAGPRSTSIATAVGAELSPPRMPQTPQSAYSEYDPVELIVDYAALPSPQPSPSSSSVAPSFSSFLPEDDDSEDGSECWPSEEKLRSRWSCSTIATLRTAAPPTSPSASARLRFHLGSVARRVRARRTGASGSDDVAVPKTHARSSSEPSANPGTNGEVGVRPDSGHEEADAESCLRRKPIPLELFLR